MNQKGVNLILMILLAFVVLAMLPPVIMIFFPLADLIMRIILVLLIFSTVRGYLGANTISLIISGVLIYLLVIRHPYITTTIYIFFFVLLMFQFLSVVIWGLGTQLRRA